MIKILEINVVLTDEATWYLKFVFKLCIGAVVERAGL